MNIKNHISDFYGQLIKYINQFTAGDKFNSDVLWNIGALFILGFVGIANNSIMKGIRGNYGFGLFSIVYAIYIIISQMATGGIHLSVLKDVSYNQEDFDKCSEIYTSGLIVSFFTSAIVSIVFYFMRFHIASLTQNPVDIAIGLGLIAPAFIFFTLNKVILSLINGLRMMKALAVFQSIRILFICIGIVTIIILGYPDSHLVLGLTFAEGLLLIVLFIYVNIKIRPPKISLDMLSWIPSHFGFGFKSFLSGVLFNINIRIDQLMLSHFFEADVVGIYTFASFFIEGINEVALALRKNIDPLIGGLFAKKRFRAINYVVYKVKKNFVPFMIAIFFISIIGFPVLSIFVGFDQSFLKSWMVLFILMLGVLYSAPIRPFFWVLTQSGKPEVFTIIMIITVLCNIVFNITLISFIGLFGAAISTSLVFIIQANLVRVFTKKILDIRL